MIAVKTLGGSMSELTTIANRFAIDIKDKNYDKYNESRNSVSLPPQGNANRR
ncbi:MULTISPECIES: hypothetical protein [unclassified Microcoleus]|uniref:hypothetical protein n=1 Tax=unclassified Microcoleus TaxID=2642155 RepID=UPI002FCFB997